MITVEEAYNRVMSTAKDFGTEKVDLKNAIGRVLSEEVSADRDFPPFDRVMMDGVAIAYSTYAAGQRIYTISGIAAAGQPQMTITDPALAIEVMTGAVLPEGTDTVIRYEDLIIENSVCTINTDITHRQSIHHQGRDHQEGEIILPQGHLIKAIDVNVLATLGYTQVSVYRQPSVAIISTGDELVDVSESPAAHQIRRSNAPMLQARLSEWGIQADDYHISDDQVAMRQKIEQLISKYDVLLFSGGVSMGRYDHLPAVLSELGVEEIFHKVRQRPGKPFWFGIGGKVTVFAFPGNPVSTLACFHKYFIPWLRSCQHLPAQDIYVRLASDFSFAPDLQYFAQAKLHSHTDGSLQAMISIGNGSGDIVHPTTMDGWVELPREKSQFAIGEIYRFIPFYSWIR